MHENTMKLLQITVQQAKTNFHHFNFSTQGYKL